MKKCLIVLLLSVTTGLAGCASNLSGDSYSRSEARRAQQVEYGEIISLRPVQIEGTKTPVGAGAAVEEGVTRSQGVEITVKLDSGRIVAIVQGLSPHEKFAVGDQVRVLTSGGTSRVAQ